MHTQIFIYLFIFFLLVFDKSPIFVRNECDHVWLATRFKGIIKIVISKLPRSANMKNPPCLSDKDRFFFNK